MALFQPNLETPGRLIRAGLSVLLFISAVIAWQHSRPLSIALAMGGAFTAFEAARGWCAVRACGVKTKY